MDMTNLGGKTNSGIGAGTGVKALSVPRLDPVFSYPVEGGDIFVYLLRTEVAKIVVITFDDTSDEYAFAVQTLTSNSKYEAVELVRNAEKTYNNFEGENPFSQLYEDLDAMGKLAHILAEFYNSGE